MRVLVVLLALPLAMFSAGIAAGPVQGNDSEGRNEVATELPTLTGRSLSEGMAPAHAASSPISVPSNGADAASSAASLAAEIIKEAEADAQASEQPRKPKNQVADRTVPAPTVTQKRPQPAEDLWGLREMGKTAVQWVTDNLPWLRADNAATSTDEQAALDETGLGASPFGSGDPEGRGNKAGATPMSGAIRATSMDPTSAGGYGEAASARRSGPGENIVRKTIEIIREVLEHPMTWLVISLFVIGGIVVKKIDRRPTK